MGNICVYVNAELCKACGYCSHVCPKEIIQFSAETNSKGHHYALVRDMGKCTGCRFCAIVCPEVAIEMEIVNRATARVEG